MPDNGPQTTQDDPQKDRSDRSQQTQPELNPGALQQQIDTGQTAPTRHYWQVPGASQTPTNEQRREQPEQRDRERERDDFSFSL